MKKLHVRINGVSTLLMNNPRGVNPLDPIAIKLKGYTSRRDKTEEDNQIISDLEWEMHIYWDDSIGLYIPNEALAKSFFEGAKLNKNGAKLQKFCQIIENRVPLDIGAVQNYEKMKLDNKFRDVRSVGLLKKRVIRTRPRFDTWRCEFDMLYDESGIDVNVIGLAIGNAGKYFGLLDHREAGYGRYAASIEEVPFSI